MGVPFLVIDNNAPNSSSKVAAGIINPVTGRRMAKTWMDDTLIPFAVKAYSDFSIFNNSPQILNKTNIIDFFSAPDRRLEFEKRANEFAEYLQWPENENEWHSSLQYEMGFGIVTPAYIANIELFTNSWKAFLKANELLIESSFNLEQLVINEQLEYNNEIAAERIIFCDGASSINNPYFNRLPFSLLKGEALIVEIKDLPEHNIYKKTHSLVPLGNHVFWAGSSYDRNFENDQPTTTFYHQTEAWLKHFVKLPFTIKKHIAAIRPATVERRMFAGFHPMHKQVGIFNGLGTKGVLLAPYFANEFATSIAHKTTLNAEVDIKRFRGILSRDTVSFEL